MYTPEVLETAALLSSLAPEDLAKITRLVDAFERGDYETVDEIKREFKCTTDE